MPAVVWPIKNVHFLNIIRGGNCVCESACVVVVIVMAPVSVRYVCACETDNLDYITEDYASSCCWTMKNNVITCSDMKPDNGLYLFIFGQISNRGRRLICPKEKTWFFHDHRSEITLNVTEWMIAAMCAALWVSSQYLWAPALFSVSSSWHFLIALKSVFRQLRDGGKTREKR